MKASSQLNTECVEALAFGNKDRLRTPALKLVRSRLELGTTADEACAARGMIHSIAPRWVELEEPDQIVRLFNLEGSRIRPPRPAKASGPVFESLPVHPGCTPHSLSSTHLSQRGTVTMANQPWFKLYATDYLLDSRVDSLPLEAQAVLVRMWCLCNIDGCCPSEIEEIARKARLSVQVVAGYVEQLLPFFDVRNGRLYSLRMEEEKRKSEAAQQGARKRGEQLRLANRSPDRSADRSTQNQSQNQTQTQSRSQYPPSSFEDPSFHSKERGYSQRDFDARDRRKLADAFNKIDLLLKASRGSGNSPSEKQIFEWACREAGISVERGLEVEERGKKWPQSQPLGSA